MTGAWCDVTRCMPCHAMRARMSEMNPAEWPPLFCKTVMSCSPRYFRLSDEPPEKRRRRPVIARTGAHREAAASLTASCRLSPPRARTPGSIAELNLMTRKPALEASTVHSTRP
jgi:hypothetical protein